MHFQDSEGPLISTFHVLSTCGKYSIHSISFNPHINAISFRNIVIPFTAKGTEAQRSQGTFTMSVYDDQQSYFIQKAFLGYKIFKVKTWDDLG